MALPVFKCFLMPMLTNHTHNHARMCTCTVVYIGLIAYMQTLWVSGLQDFRQGGAIVTIAELTKGGGKDHSSTLALL